MGETAIKGNQPWDSYSDLCILLIIYGPSPNTDNKFYDLQNCKARQAPQLCWAWPTFLCRTWVILPPKVLSMLGRGKSLREIQHQAACPALCTWSKGIKEVLWGRGGSCGPEFPGIDSFSSHVIPSSSTHVTISPTCYCTSLECRIFCRLQNLPNMFYTEEHVQRMWKCLVHRIQFGNPVTPPLLYLVCLTRPGQTIRHFRQGEIYRGGLTRSLLPPSHTCQPSRPPGAPPTTFARPPKWF